MPFDHFNLVADLYERAAQFVLTEPLAEILSLSPDVLLLDVGGGTGRVAAALRGLAREVVVADPSEGMLRRAAAKGLASVRAPAEYLPFPSGIFDRILMRDALHHVRDQRRTIHELWRLLAPGGRLVIVEPDIRQFGVKLIALMEKLLLMRSHILSGEKIAGFFDGRAARTRIVYSENNVIILAERVR